MWRPDFTVAGHLMSTGARTHGGTRLLNGLAVLAVTVAAWLMLITAGGMGRFYRRWHDIPDYLNARIANLPNVDSTLMIYVTLGAVACVLILPPAMALAANAAILGAAGREEKWLCCAYSAPPRCAPPASP